MHGGAGWARVYGRDRDWEVRHSRFDSVWTRSHKRDDRLIRDAMVEKTWEGTENIMALDMMRAAKDGKVAVAFAKVLCMSVQGEFINEMVICLSGPQQPSQQQAQRPSCSPRSPS